jgi:AcrR family transcriptional regulator
MAEPARLGRPKEARDTAELCLVAAESRFANFGFAGTVLREIAEDVGVTSAAVIHHFGTKERLYARVLDRFAASLNSYIERAVATKRGRSLAGPSGNGVEVIIAIFDSTLNWHIEHPHYSQLLMHELMENRSRISKAKRFYLTDLISEYVRRIAEGQRAGRFRQFDAEIFVLATLGAISHFSVAAPTIDLLLKEGKRSSVARFRLNLHENVALMLTGSTSTSGRLARLTALSSND